MHSNIPCSLTRHLPQTFSTDGEMFAMRRAAWRKRGIAVLRVTDIRDEWPRQAVVNEADRRYGQREDKERK